MDWKTFIIELIDKVIWPISIFGLILLLKEPILKLIPSLKKLEMGEVKMEFDPDFEKLKNDAKATLGKTGKDKGMSKIGKETLESMADISPNAAIIAAWREIELVTIHLITKYTNEIDFETTTPYILMQNFLDENKIVETKKLKIFNDLRQIRNRVSHAQKYYVSKESALEYINIAWELKKHLEDIPKQKESEQIDASVNS